jgi:hypothetical protein
MECIVPDSAGAQHSRYDCRFMALWRMRSTKDKIDLGRSPWPMVRGAVARESSDMESGAERIFHGG